MCYFNFNSNLIGYLKIFNQSECLKQASRNFTREILFKGPQAFGVKTHSSVTILSRFSKRQISFRALVGQPLADKWVGLDLERWILFFAIPFIISNEKSKPFCCCCSHFRIREPKILYQNNRNGRHCGVDSVTRWLYYFQYLATYNVERLPPKQKFCQNRFELLSKNKINPQPFDKD